MEGGLRPRRRYTVGDALDGWLAVGVDGLSARTVSLYRDTIARAPREELGTVRLTDLTAGDVQGAAGVCPPGGPRARAVAAAAGDDRAGFSPLRTEAGHRIIPIRREPSLLARYDLVARYDAAGA